MIDINIEGLSLDEMKHKRAEFHDEAEDIYEGADGPLTGDEKERFESLLDKRDALSEAIEETRDGADRLREFDPDATEEPVVGDRARFGEDVRVHGADPFRASENDPAEVRDRAWRKWLVNGPGSLVGQERKFLGGQGNSITARASIRRTRSGEIETRSTALQLTSTGAAGGNLVPTEFMAELFRDIEDQGAMRDVANVVRTDNGRTMEIPLDRDATAQGEIVGEGSTISTTTHIKYGQTTIGSHMYRSGPVLASFELNADSAFDMENEIRGKLSQRISNAQEEDFVINSTGTTGPDGINTATTGAVALTAPSTGTNSGSTNLSLADLQDLEDSVKPGWKRNFETRWVMSQDAWSEVKKLADADNRPFINMNLTEGFEARLLGHPVVVNEFVDPFGSTGNKPIFFGAFGEGYMVRDVNELRLVRYSEKFANQGAIGFQAFTRTDAKPVFGTTTAARKPFRCIVLEST